MGKREAAATKNVPEEAWCRRTVRLKGQSMRVRLEVSFWQALDDIALREGMNWEELCQAINQRRGALPLARAIRFLAIGYYRTAALPADRAPASALDEVLSQVFGGRRTADGGASRVRADSGKYARGPAKHSPRCRRRRSTGPGRGLRKGSIRTPTGILFNRARTWPVVAVVGWQVRTAPGLCMLSNLLRLDKQRISA